MPDQSSIWLLLKNNVIDAGLCTHCGTCVGLNEKILEFEETSFGPLPRLIVDVQLNVNTYYACPGKGVPYPTLFKFFNTNEKQNYLSGNVINTWIGYSKNETLRMNSASGGVITSTLLFLLKKNLIDGAVVLKSGSPEAQHAMAIIATTEKEIIESAQSVYMPIPVNNILAKTKKFEGKLGFVGLPDQVASIRMLQMLKDPSTKNIEYIIGPYTGTNMYKGAIRSFLRGRGVRDDKKIISIAKKYKDARKKSEFYGAFKNANQMQKVLEADGSNSEIIITSVDTAQQYFGHIGKGVFAPGKYVLHPKKLNVLVPFESFHSIILREHDEEFIRFFASLGAKKIAIQTIEGVSIDGSGVIPGRGKAKAKYKKIEDADKTYEFFPQAIETDSVLKDKVWIQDFPKMLTFLETRKSHRLKRFEETVNIDTSFGIEVEVVLQFNGAFKWNKTSSYRYEVEFYSEKELSGAG